VQHPHLVTFVIIFNTQSRSYIVGIAALPGTVIVSLIWNLNKRRKSHHHRDGNYNEPETIVLHHFDPESPYRDKSILPFSIKVECFLRMCGISYKMPPFSVTALFSNPKRKLPTCEIDGVSVPDSTFILRFLLTKCKYASCCQAALCDSELTPAQRALGIAIKALCEDQLYWIMGYWRYKWEPGFCMYWSVITTLHFVPQPLC
jgi:hypothetical protein